MLVLSRKLGEEIVIGDEHIVVAIERIQGDRVRLSIKAPAADSIFRGELVEKDQDRFDVFLRNEHYSQALTMLSQKNYKPRADQVFQLELGLEEEGLLTDEIKTFLRSYKPHAS